MTPLTDRRPAGRWLLLMLVVLVVLGHVCDLAAFADLDAHHPVDSHADEQVSSCDAVPATSSSGHTQVWAPPDIVLALPVADPTPARRAAWSFEDPVRLIERLPLFLLHASLLI
jgi:hypothetical protein